VSHKDSFIADQRGAVAFEMLAVFLFQGVSLLLPLADVAVAGLQYISAWQALRAFGQDIQYKPLDVTTWNATGGWASTLPTTVAGYPINNLQVVCGDTQQVCSPSNDGSGEVKYFSYTTTVTFVPILLRRVLCTSGNANPCSFTLSYSERL
jgi:hypothetical protein